jgi:hypothetical protein
MTLPYAGIGPGVPGFSSRQCVFCNVCGDSDYGVSENSVAKFLQVLYNLSTGGWINKSNNGKESKNEEI